MAFYLGSTLAIDSDGYAVTSDPIGNKNFDSGWFRSPMWDSDEHEWWDGAPTNRYLDTSGRTGAWQDIHYSISVATGGGIIAVGDYLWTYTNTINSSFNKEGRVDIFDANGNFIKYITAEDSKLSGVGQIGFGKTVRIGGGVLAVMGEGPRIVPASVGQAVISLFDLSGTHIKNIVSGETDISVNTWGERAISIGCGKIVAADFNWDSANATGDWIEEGRIHIWDIDTEEDSASTTEIVVNLGQASKLALGHRINDTKVWPNTQFGKSHAIGHGRIVVGAPGDRKDGQSFGDQGAGSVFILDLDGNFIQKIINPDNLDETGVLPRDDGFGSSVAIGCGLIAVGAPGRNIGGTNTGSIYVFDLSGKYLYRADQTGGDETSKHDKEVDPDAYVGSYQGKIVLDNNKLVYSSFGNGVAIDDDFINIINLDNAAGEDPLLEVNETYRGSYWGRSETWDLKNGVLAAVTAEFNKYGSSHDDSGELWIHKTALSTSGIIDKIITKS